MRTCQFMGIYHMQESASSLAHHLEGRPNAMMQVVFNTGFARNAKCYSAMTVRACEHGRLLIFFEMALLSLVCQIKNHCEGKAQAAILDSTWIVRGHATFLTCQGALSFRHEQSQQVAY